MGDRKLWLSLIKGILTYVPGIGAYIEKKKEKSHHSGSDANFAFSLWFSIMILLKEKSINVDYSKIGEVGNGGSLGVAFCALLAGSKEYYSFELRTHISLNEQKKMLHNIYRLLKEKTAIKRYSNLNIPIDNNSFPDTLIQTTSFEQERIYSELLIDIDNKLTNSKYIKLIPDWEKQNSLNLSFIYSRAVMEHVNCPANVYDSIAKHLKHGGHTFHDIELHSHGITDSMNGHIKIPNYLWILIHGNRKYFLNRYKWNDHIKSLQDKGLVLQFAVPNLTIQNNYRQIFGGVLLAKKTYE